MQAFFLNVLSYTCKGSLLYIQVLHLTHAYPLFIIRYWFGIGIDS